MPKKERQELIEKLQTLREDRLCAVYVTSTRSGHEVSIADDVVHLMYDHFEAGKEKAKKGIDLFIHSNGGQATVPWRVVSLIREYTEEFTALVRSAPPRSWLWVPKKSSCTAWGCLAPSILQ